MSRLRLPWRAVFALTRISCSTRIVSMKNVTITLDEEVARWARIRAAKEDTSVSRMVGEILREKMLDEGAYQRSMEEYLARSPRTLKGKGDRYPDREGLHDRTILR